MYENSRGTDQIMYTGGCLLSEKYSIGNIFGSYILNCRTVPGTKPFTPEEEEEQKAIIDELSAYFEEA